MTVIVERIIHSKRKTIGLIVEPDGSVTVRAPQRMSEKTIREFVEGHAKWVERKQAEIRTAIPEQSKQYRPGENFLYLGKIYPLEVVKDQKRKLVLEDCFKLAESVQENAELIFRNWYRRQVGQMIEERVVFFAGRYQLQYEKIRITSARTRWGSCSAKGVLSFSWRLIMTPVEVVDYVVIHELVHTIHHNHSKSFWKTVEKLLPDYRKHRKWLRQNGQHMIL